MHFYFMWLKIWIWLNLIKGIKPRLKNRFISHLICEYSKHKISPFWYQLLSKQRSEIIIGELICNYDNKCCNCFLESKIYNVVMFLIKCWFRNQCTIIGLFIIIKRVLRYINWNTKNYQFVFKLLSYLLTL